MAVHPLASYPVCRTIGAQEAYRAKLDLGCRYREERYERYVGDTRYITAEYIEVYRQGDRRETGSIHGFRRLPFLALRPQGRQASAAVSTNEMELNVAEIFLDSSTAANQVDPLSVDALVAV